MVASIARQSVIRKCLLQKSILLGNYEFYYLSGLLKKLYGLELQEDMKPLELFGTISEQLENLHPADEKENYLIMMVTNYEPTEDYDDQMKRLFRWGANEPDLWQVTTTEFQD